MHQRACSLGERRLRNRRLTTCSAARVFSKRRKRHCLTLSSLQRIKRRCPRPLGLECRTVPCHGIEAIFGRGFNSHRINHSVSAGPREIFTRTLRLTCTRSSLRLPCFPVPCTARASDRGTAAGCVPETLCRLQSLTQERLPSPPSRPSHSTCQTDRGRCLRRSATCQEQNRTGSTSTRLRARRSPSTCSCSTRTYRAARTTGRCCRDRRSACRHVRKKSSGWSTSSPPAVGCSPRFPFPHCLPSRWSPVQKCPAPATESREGDRWQ